MLIVDCEQRGEQWFNERLGKPSASNFKKILSPTGKKSEQRTKYMYELVDNLITGKTREKYQSAAMKEGSDREEESRTLYELMYGVSVLQVGLVYPDERKQYLCSPDGLILEHEKGLEMKNVDPEMQIETLLANKMPTIHIPQVQGSMFITGYKTWDFLSYCPGYKPFIVEIKRDDDYITKLEAELNSFNEELLQIVERLKQ